MLLSEMKKTEIEAFYNDALSAYAAAKAKGLKLDMSRGKPSSAQLDLSNDMLRMDADVDFKMDGIDVRNYGNLDGLPSCKAMFADILGVKPQEVFAAGSSSLSLMYDVLEKAFIYGMLHSPCPWSKLDKVKFLCPVPGYDRHFTVSETLGMELIPVEMNAEGPDMDAVERLIADPAVKGMWCVPKYSNPEGIIYSDATVKRIAAMKPAAPDFILMWDNAYCIHEFSGDFVPFPDILTECRNAGNPDMPIEFASTSKITFPGAGVSCFATSEANLAHIKKRMNAQIISYDKVNQYRHVRFLKDKAGAIAHMKKHAAILGPKFDIVSDALEREVTPLGIARFIKPKGGYFISLYVMDGCAKRIHALCKEAGVVMTGAGAPYPYKFDPADSNLRIAPSYPPNDELKAAVEVLCICIKLAAAEKLLGK